MKRRMNQFAKAFAKNKEAQILLEEKAEFADKRLMNVAKKKRAILNRTVPKFVEVYSQIQKVELKNRPSDNGITIRNDIQNKEALNELKLTSKKSFTDKELNLRPADKRNVSVNDYGFRTKFICGKQSIALCQCRIFTG